MIEKKEITKKLIKNVLINSIIFTAILLIFDFIIYNQVVLSLYKDIDLELLNSVDRTSPMENIGEDNEKVKNDDLKINDGILSQNISPRLIIIERNEER